MSTRFFTRCTGCLEIAAIDAVHFPFDLTCGICGSTIENMGRVQGERLVHDHERCACDERCTSARGPLCSCSCGGQNHGAGLAATVRFTTDAGPKPVLQQLNSLKAADALARFQAFTAARQGLKIELGHLLDRRRAGEFLPRGDFDRMLSLQRLNGDVCKAKTHKTRMRKLQDAGFGA